MSTGIHSIESYPLPSAEQVPPQAVGWKPDPGRAVLLLHDMQEYFLRFFPADRQPGIDLVGNAVRLRQECALRGVPVVYTAQPGSMSPEQRGLLADFWGPGMSRSEQDRRIEPRLAPRAGDRVLTKWRYSAFHHTELLQLMRDRGRDQLIIGGVFAHLGCLATAMDAYAHDIQPFLVADAVAAFSAETHRQALGYAAEYCAATPTTQDVLDALASAESHVR